VQGNPSAVLRAGVPVPIAALLAKLGSSLLDRLKRHRPEPKPVRKS
jgi:hypothetical protein